MRYPQPPYTDDQLRYAAFARCSCGAGLAYAPGLDPRPDAWFCSVLLKDAEADCLGHDPGKPFAFWEIKSELQASANGATTRPEGAPKERLKLERRFRKKPVVIEAITFEALVEHGIASGGNVVNGMPWSFQYKGQPITHEDDDCYLIPTLEGTMRFERGDMLITGVAGEIYPCKLDIFEKTYEAA